MTRHKMINLTKQLVIVPLKDGTTVHLAPAEQVQVEAFLLTGNDKVKRLVDRKVIHLDPKLPESDVTKPAEAKPVGTGQPRR